MGLTIPGSVTSIGYDVLYESGLYNNKSKWTEGALYVSSCLLHTDKSVLSGNYAVLQGTRLIADYAFSGCEDLTGVTFAGNAPLIGDASFNQITATAYYPLGDVTWTEDVRRDYGGTLTWESYGEVAAEFTYTVKGGEATITGYVGAGGDVVIPAVLGGYPVTGVGICAFANCMSVTGLTVSEGITRIEDRAFELCRNLTALVLPDSLTSIGHDAFWGCTELKTVTIPKNVSQLAGDAFGLCAGLTGFIVAAENSSYATVSGAVFNYDKTKLVCCPAGKHGTYTIPAGVECIGDNAFAGCLSVTDVSIPDSVTVIEPKAFRYCVSLTEITIPNSVTDMGSGAFVDCQNLSNVTFTGGAPTIDTDAFEGITAQMNYPAGDPTWTEDVRQNYGGTLTWIAVGGVDYIPGDLDGDGETTDADAIYLLMYTFFEEDYPVSQPCDYDGDGEITDADAIYLLMYTFFPEDYPIV